MTLSNFTALIYLIGGIVIFLLGLLIFREDARQRLNRITAAMLFLVALAPILGAFGLLLDQVAAQNKVDVDLLSRLYLVSDRASDSPLAPPVAFGALYPTNDQLVVGRVAAARRARAEPQASARFRPDLAAVVATVRDAVQLLARRAGNFRDVPRNLFCRH